MKSHEFTSHASTRFVVAIFARLITQIGKEAASHMCRRGTKKRRVRFERKKPRNIKQRVSRARERAAARQRVGWIFRGNPLPLTVSSPFRSGPGPSKLREREFTKRKQK